MHKQLHTVHGYNTVPHNNIIVGSLLNFGLTSGVSIRPPKKRSRGRDKVLLISLTKWNTSNTKFADEFVTK